MRKFKLLLFAVAILACYSLTAQVAITTDGSSANASAMLDVQSTSKGFLPPRMTMDQELAIISPAAGLMVWCSNCGESGELQVFNGTSWTNMMGGAPEGSFAIGQSYGGGIIFYLDGRLHGLISATSDQSTGAVWGCYGTLIGTETAIGTGQANTTLIVNGCSTEGIAARICDDLVLNGYSDWFLPSSFELFQMFTYKEEIGNFAGSIYLSSSEYTAGLVRVYDFPGVESDELSKENPYYVRAVRSF